MGKRFAKRVRKRAGAHRPSSNGADQTLSRRRRVAAAFVCFLVLIVLLWRSGVLESAIFEPDELETQVQSVEPPDLAAPEPEVHLAKVAMSGTSGQPVPAVATDAESAEPATITDHEREKFLDLIDDLISDDTRYNALHALGALRRQRGARELLAEVLLSDDYQQRQLAAHLLRNASWPPTEELLAVTVEGLGHDELNQYHTINNASGGYYYLRKHMQAARPHLVRALRSPDEQRAFLAACLLGRGGETASIATTSAILIDHLASNDIRGDARMSCQALYRLGPAVVPYLERWRDSDDRQQRDAVELIYLNLTDPTTDRVELERRYKLNHITRVEWDPSTSKRSHRIPTISNRDLRRNYYRTRSGWADVASLKLLEEEHGRSLRYRTDYTELDHMQVAVGIWEGHEFVRLLTLQIHESGEVHEQGRSGRWRKVGQVR